MYIRTANILIRAFEKKDAENLYRIVRENRDNALHAGLVL